MYVTPYICNSHVVRESRLLHVAYRCIRRLPLEQLTGHTRVASLDTCVYVPLTLKMKTHDYLRLVKYFTINLLNFLNLLNLRNCLISSI